MLILFTLPTPASHSSANLGLNNAKLVCATSPIGTAIGEQADIASQLHKAHEFRRR